MSCFVCPVSGVRHCDGGCGLCDDCPGEERPQPPKDESDV